MKNRIHISSDGINAYATIKVNASKTGIRILSILLIVELVLITWLFSQATYKDILEMIIPLLIIMVLFVGLPAKYLLWNLYGTEELIVNTKSISWRYNYGFYQTNLKIVKYNKLGIGYEKVRETGNGEIGRLVFYNYRKDDNLPELIHQTSVLLSMDELEKFDKKILDIFENEFYNKNNFIPFSLN